MEKTVFAIVKIDVDRSIMYSSVFIDKYEALKKFEELVREETDIEEEVQEALTNEYYDTEYSESIIIERTTLK